MAVSSSLRLAVNTPWPEVETTGTSLTPLMTSRNRLVPFSRATTIPAATRTKIAVVTMTIFFIVHSPQSGLGLIETVVCIRDGMRCGKASDMPHPDSIHSGEIDQDPCEGLRGAFGGYGCRKH